MKRKKRKLNMKGKALLIVLFVPVAVTVFTLTAIIWASISNPDLIKKSASVIFEDRSDDIPEEFIPVYKNAAEIYNVPWTLLAAHHRIETRFSTMDPLLSPVGAEGHMQFMPCTFVGWTYPGCSGLGQGEIPEEDKTNPEVIAKYGGHGVDANGDGIADPYNIEDAIHSAAKYLAESGAAEGDYEKAIFDYNKSDKYVRDVLWFFNKYEDARKSNEASK